MMPIILAIESDRRQAARVAALAPGHIDAEIIVVGSIAAALDILKTRRPDLVLTPPLFSTRDDATLTARLRELEDDGVELPTLVTPLLAPGEGGEAAKGDRTGGLLNRLRKQKTAPAAASTGCSPAIFAAQITEYLVRLVAERHDREQARRKEEWVNTRGSASAPMLGELLTMPPVEPAARFAEPEPEPSTYAAFEVNGETAVVVTTATFEEETFAIDAPGIEPSMQHLELLQSEPIDETAVADAEDPESIGGLVVQPFDPLPDELSVNLLAARADDGTEAPEVVEHVHGNTEAELEPDGPWGDLESVLEDLELEAEFSEEASHPAGFKPDAIELTAPAEFEPNAVEVPAPDELWAQLRTAAHAIAPIEGPAMKKRRPPTPPKTPKAVRAKAKPTVPLKPVRPAVTKQSKKPMQDEWGLYDPEQCGFAALLARLEELTETDAAEKEGEGRSAIMRR